MASIGLTLDRTTHFLPPEQLSNLVVKIERLGFESVWLLDSFGREPFLACGFMLSQTSTLKVATGVATVYGRDPTGAVQALQTLSELYPGRFIMGLGTSNPIVIAKRKGEWVAPLPKMTAYLEEMAQVQLAAAKPEVMAPLNIAAHAPGLQKLATKHAQGIVTWMMPAPIIKEARERVGGDLTITSQILCVMSSDANEARSVARAYLAMYLALPYYQTAFTSAGFEPADWSEGGSDRLIDSIVAWGSTSEILKRVEQFGSAGADRVVLNVVREDESKREAGKPMAVTGDWEAYEALSAILPKK